jgi:hypothetical protein
MGFKGENFVRLKGFLAYPKLTVTTNGYNKFDGKIVIPLVYKNNKTGEEIESKKFVKISAWGDVAEALGCMSPDTCLEIIGFINERSYEGKCEHCGGVQKKYWTDIQVDTFTVIDNTGE